MSLFMAGAIFGDLGLSLFAAVLQYLGDMGLLFEMLCFPIQNAAGTRKREPRRTGGLRTDRFMWSDHSRIMLGSAAEWHGDFTDLGLKTCHRSYVVFCDLRVAPCIVTNVLHVLTSYCVKSLPLGGVFDESLRAL